MNEQFQPLFPELTDGRVRRVLEARRARVKFFPAELFSDPAWDLLLELYARELAGQRVAVTELSAITGLAATTSLRWICKLEADGLVVRADDPLDRRRQRVGLTAEAVSKMQRYFADISSAFSV